VAIVVRVVTSEKSVLRLVFTDELCDQKWLFKFHYSASIFITSLTLKWIAINWHFIAKQYPQDSQCFTSYIIYFKELLTDTYCMTIYCTNSRLCFQMIKNIANYQILFKISII